MRRIAASSAGLIRVLPLFVVNGQIIATRRGSVLRYTHADHLGSASLQTDTNGNSVASTNVGHWSYGTVRTGSPTALNTDRTYTGQKQDSTGLLYYNARYYDPTLGQFLSPDTLVPDAGLVLDYNRYMYVRGNPLKYTDPSGHDPQCEVGTSACDAEWTLWRQYQNTVDSWSSWEQFLQGYNNYMQYAANPSLYLQDMQVINQLIDGDIQSASLRNAAANAYTQHYLGQNLTSLVVPSEYAYTTLAELEATGDTELYQGTLLIFGQLFLDNEVGVPGNDIGIAIVAPNQLNKLIKRGKAPNGFVRVDTPKVANEQLHIHVNGGALNIDGTWKHVPSTPLNNTQRNWLQQQGWTVPFE